MVARVLSVYFKFLCGSEDVFMKVCEGMCACKGGRAFVKFSGSCLFVNGLCAGRTSASGCFGSLFTALSSSRDTKHKCVIKPIM